MCSDSERLHSLLAIDSGDVRLDLGASLPSVIYRAFSCVEDRENFLQGNIWFAGVNQLRYCLSEDRRDKYECRNDFSHAMCEYSLSFFIEGSDLSKECCIAITNVNDFIEQIRRDLEKTKGSYCHQISWLSEDELKQIPSQEVPVVSGLMKHRPNREDQWMQLYLYNIKGHHLNYSEKFTSRKPTPALEAIPGNVYSKDEQFAKNKEWRVSLTAGIKGSDSSLRCLYNFVQYLKLSCSSIGKYCKKID